MPGDDPTLRGVTVRGAARLRLPLDGTAAQKLEHDLTIAERERDAALARVKELEEVLAAPATQSDADALGEAMRLLWCTAERVERPTESTWTSFARSVLAALRSWSNGWRAELVAAGLVRNKYGWARPGSMYQSIARTHPEGPWWAARDGESLFEVARGPKYATEEEAARAWLDAQAGSPPRT